MWSFKFTKFGTDNKVQALQSNLKFTENYFMQNNITKNELTKNHAPWRTQLFDTTHWSKTSKGFFSSLSKTICKPFEIYMVEKGNRGKKKELQKPM